MVAEATRSVTVATHRTENTQKDSAACLSGRTAILAGRSRTPSSMETLPLRAALKHGAVVAMANWPLVLIHFALDSFYRVALAVPILGGALMVAAGGGTQPG